MHFTDSHAHITAESVYAQKDLILKNASEANVDTIINVCTDELSLQRGLELRQHYPCVHLAAAVHPHDAQGQTTPFFESISQHAQQGHLAAIGETGLDYFYLHASKEEQQNSLRQHLRLALACKLPVIIHCREAFADLFPILDQEYKQGNVYAPGVLHCFTGTMQEAEQVLQRGWYVSFSGIVTFKKSIDLQEVAKKVPLSQLLIETDTPYLAPQSQRGKPNQPAYLPEIAAFIASLQNIPVEAVAQATRRNAQLLFSLPN